LKPKTPVSEGSGDGALKSEKPKSVKKKAPTVDVKRAPINAHFSVIFVCRSYQPTILHDHLPQLITTASLAHPELPATRLVELPKDSDARLCKALSIPRVSFIGILEGAPSSKSLVDLIRECVPEIEIPWLQQAKESKYLPVKINAIETFSTVVKKDQA
jgi:ribonuclease P/MRP protein subunit POP3